MMMPAETNPAKVSVGRRMKNLLESDQGFPMFINRKIK
jgi:hypothetical protein